jgi:hypothetical protein
MMPMPNAVQSMFAVAPMNRAIHREGCLENVPEAIREHTKEASSLCCCVSKGKV